VVGTAARSGRGLNALMDAIQDITSQKNESKASLRIIYDDPVEQAVDLLEPALRNIPAMRLTAAG
jgi:Fe2+ transport system protein B